MDDITPGYKKPKKSKLNLKKSLDPRPNIKLDSLSFSQRRKAHKEADIIQIWEEQRRIRDEEERLEQEYQAAKTRAKALKSKIKQNNRLITDSRDLQDTLPPEVLQFSKQSLLWLKKTYKQSVLKILIFWLRLRRSLGIPMKKKQKKVSYNKKIARATIVILIVIALGYLLISKVNSKSGTSSGTVAGENKSEILLNQKPDFAVLLPTGKNQDSVGGFAKTSPPSAPAAYTYLDNVGGIGIKVSQQQLPENLKKDPAQFEKLAKDFNATKVLEIDGNQVYLGLSEKGPQSVVFRKNDLLVLIAAEKEVEDVAWVQYISNLKQ